MRPKIYLFGDSITEESFGVGGWGSSLAHQFSRTVDVVLRGYSGYNTRWALKVLERIFPATAGGGEDAPLAVTVFFGANDACLADRCSAFEHVPLDEYKQNLRAIVSFFQETLAQNSNYPHYSSPIDEESRLQYPYIENPNGLPERTNEAAGNYAKACIHVAGECGLPVIDIWTKMQELSDWKKSYLRDGLHLTEAGNRLVFELVVETLREGGLSLETLPVDLPLIAEIDPQNPLKSFEN